MNIDNSESGFRLLNEDSKLLLDDPDDSDVETSLPDELVVDEDSLVNEDELSDVKRHHVI